MLREARFSILDNGIAPNNQILNVVIVEKSQQIGEVGVDEHHCPSRARHARSAPKWHQNELEMIALAKIAGQMIDLNRLFFPFVPGYLCSLTIS